MWDKKYFVWCKEANDKSQESFITSQTLWRDVHYVTVNFTSDISHWYSSLDLIICYTVNIQDFIWIKARISLSSSRFSKNTVSLARQYISEQDIFVFIPSDWELLFAVKDAFNFQSLTLACLSITGLKYCNLGMLSSFL